MPEVLGNTSTYGCWRLPRVLVMVGRGSACDAFVRRAAALLECCQAGALMLGLTFRTSPSRLFGGAVCHVCNEARILRARTSRADVSNFGEHGFEWGPRNGSLVRTSPAGCKVPPVIADFTITRGSSISHKSRDKTRLCMNAVTVLYDEKRLRSSTGALGDIQLASLSSSHLLNNRWSSESLPASSRSPHPTLTTAELSAWTGFAYDGISFAG